MQSSTGQTILAWYGLPTDQFITMLFIDNGQLYTRSTAAIKIASQLLFPWSLSRMLIHIPHPIRDWFYDRIAINRYRVFGKRYDCYLQDEKRLNGSSMSTRDKTFSIIQWIARISVAVVWCYRGLVPKLLGASKDEIRAALANGLPEGIAPI
ncbi:MAG: DCC1-like thiol-disulfide oxidoreductase family protein, partial [Steroidobacteraceae bacterium]